jgi:hypothetical protein
MFPLIVAIKMAFNQVKIIRKELKNDPKYPLNRSEIMRVMSFLRDNTTILPTDDEVKILWNSMINKKKKIKIKHEQQSLY